MSRGGELVTGLTNVFSVRRVFGRPIERGGVTVIPVAAVAGGGGGGAGSGEDEDQAGGGFGMAGRAVGVYVIADDTVTWQPAVDVTRIVLAGEVVALAVVLVVRRLVLSRPKRRWR